LQSFGNGGGYPLFNYYSPLTYYLSAGLIYIGINPLNSVKLLFQGAYVLLAVGMYFYLRSGIKVSKKLALAGAVAAIFSAYFNYDAYTRGALAELLGFALLPSLLGLFELLYTKKKWYYLFGSALFLSLIFFFHAITGIIAVLLLSVLVVVRLAIRKEAIVAQVSSLSAFFGLSGLLSAAYLLPVLLEKNYVRYSQVGFVQTGFKDAAVSLKEILGFTSINPEIKPITLGIGLSLLVAMSLCVLIQKYFKMNNKSRFSAVSSALVSYAAVLLTILFLQTPLSWIFWEHSSILQTLQFPYRFLSLLTVLSIAFVLKTSAQYLNRPMTATVVVLILIASYQTRYFAVPSSYYFSDRFAAEDSCTTTTWQQEYLPVATKECIIKDSLPLAQGMNGTEVVSQSLSERNRILIELNAEPGTIILSKYYFPGWTAYSGLTKLPIYPTTESGLLTIEIPENTTQIQVVLEKTQTQKTAEWISVITAVFMILYAIHRTTQVVTQR